VLLAAAAAIARATETSLLAALPTREETPEPESGAERWISLGVLSGSTVPDHALSNYQWSTSPHLGWGGQALLGFGRFATGARVWSTATDQAIGLPDEASARVRRTSLELVGHGRLARWGGAELSGIASVGWLHLGYQPDQVTISSGGSPVVVDLAPVNEWIAGGGLAIKRALASAWTLGLELDRRMFRLDTAHRDGNTIVERRETFGDWSARLELARLYSWR